ncbi:MAG: hypothetical protein JWO35_462 [Candidatus Saccharibacteria bacterium]|nr:hypothetical protein [Candidatus Saccharibacteria bacterium]
MAQAPYETSSPTVEQLDTIHAHAQDTILSLVEADQTFARTAAYHAGETANTLKEHKRAAALTAVVGAGAVFGAAAANASPETYSASASSYKAHSSAFIKKYCTARVRVDRFEDPDLKDSNSSLSMRIILVNEGKPNAYDNYKVKLNKGVKFCDFLAVDAGHTYLKPYAPDVLTSTGAELHDPAGSVGHEEQNSLKTVIAAAIPAKKGTTKRSSEK